MKLTTSDCVEIYYALPHLHGDKRVRLLENIVGSDGETLAKGKSKFTPAQARSVYLALMRKRGYLLEGHFDDYKGQVDKPHSETGKWAAHLGRIMAKIGVDGMNLLTQQQRARLDVVGWPRRAS